MIIANRVLATGEIVPVPATSLTSDDLSGTYLCPYCGAPVWPRCFYSDKRITHFGGQHYPGCKGGPLTTITTFEGFEIREDKALNHIDKPLGESSASRNNQKELTEEEQIRRQDKIDNFKMQTLANEIKTTEKLYSLINTQPGFFTSKGINLKHYYFNEESLEYFHNNGIGSDMLLVQLKRCNPEDFGISRTQYEMVLRDCGKNISKQTIFFKAEIKEPTHNVKFWRDVGGADKNTPILIWAKWEDVSNGNRRIYKAIINSWQYYIDDDK